MDLTPEMEAKFQEWLAQQQQTTVEPTGLPDVTATPVDSPSSTPSPTTSLPLGVNTLPVAPPAETPAATPAVEAPVEPPKVPDVDTVVEFKYFDPRVGSDGQPNTSRFGVVLEIVRDHGDGSEMLDANGNPSPAARIGWFTEVSDPIPVTDLAW